MGNLAALILRVALGGLMAGHGAQKPAPAGTRWTGPSACASPAGSHP